LATRYTYRELNAWVNPGVQLAVGVPVRAVDDGDGVRPSGGDPRQAVADVDPVDEVVAEAWVEHVALRQ
jgi:hypothetical protein